MIKIAISVALLAFSQLAAAQVLEEIIVSARKSSVETIPGSFLQRKADFLLLNVRIENDSRDEDQREEEIYSTLKELLSDASKTGDVEISLVSEGGIVVPMTSDNYQVRLNEGGRPDTSQASISLKTPIPENEVDGQKLVDKLSKFLDRAKKSGRTELNAIGDVEVTVVGPNQYRPQVIELFASDVEDVTASLGDDYKVIVDGIDQPVDFYRMGLLEIALFIPYSYTVIPNTVNSYTNFSPEY